MKRTLERLVFMLIGATLVGIAYLLGNADRDAIAQGTVKLEDVEITGRLVVKDEIIVGNFDKDPKNAILITAEDDDNVGISLYYQLTDGGTAASVIIAATSNSNGEPFAAVTLKDNRGNNISGYSNSGWD